MNIDKHIENWAKTINESQEISIKEDSSGNVELDNFEDGDGWEISENNILIAAIELATGWESTGSLRSDDNGQKVFSIEKYKNSDLTFVVSMNGPESEFWKKLEDFCRHYGQGNGESIVKEIYETGSGYWAFPLYII